MKSNNNELMIVKNAVFMLLCQLDGNLAEHINKDKIDSQAIFALTKLVDSFIKLSQAELVFGEKDNAEVEDISYEDKVLLGVYEENKKNIGPI